MLMLTRKEGERISVEGPCEIIISQIKGGRVKIGIEAVDSVKILRTELTRHDTSKPGKAAEAANDEAVGPFPD